MKRILLLFMILCLSVFPACSDAEEPAETEYAAESAQAVVLSPLPCEDPGTAGYLVDADFALTEENLISSLEDFFAAPCAMDFYLEDEDGSVYRCDDAALNRRFGDVLCGAEFNVISMRKYDAVVALGSVEDPYLEASYLRAYFANGLGQVSLIIGKDGTYIDFYRAVEKENEMNESGRTFYTAVDLFDELAEVKAMIFEECTVIP